MGRKFRWVGAILLGLALGSVTSVSAQPYSAQIQAALRDFLTRAHTWTATQTFAAIVTSGCTGCATPITIGDTQVAYADGANNIAGDAGLTYNKTTDTLTAGNLTLPNDGSVLNVPQSATFSRAALILGAGSSEGDGLVVVPSGTGLGTDFYLEAQTGAGRLFLLGGDHTGTAGYAKVKGGNSSAGTGGAARIQGGDGTVAGGATNIDGGNGPTTPGDVNLQSLEVNGLTISWGDFIIANGKSLRTDTTTAHTACGLSVYDVDGAAYACGILGTNGNTPDITISTPTGGTMTIRPSTYKSSDGSTGVTVAACTSFKNGLCVAGT